MKLNWDWELGTCPCGSGFKDHELKDGYGAFICIACEACKGEKLSKLRADIMERYPRPSWFEDVHMGMYPERDRDSEWVRLTSADRDDYDRDDVSSAIMIEGLRSLVEERVALRDKRLLEGLARDLGVSEH